MVFENMVNDVWEYVKCTLRTLQMMSENMVSGVCDMVGVL